MWSKLLCSFTASVRIETTCIDETTMYQNNRFHRLPSFSMRYLHNFVKPSVTAVVFRTITMQRLACSNWAGWILHNTWRLSRVRWRLVKTQNKDSFFYCFKVGLVFTICDWKTKRQSPFSPIERFSYDLEMKTREQNGNNKRTEVERFDWFIERIQTRVAFGWLSERSGEKASCPRTF